MNKFKDQTYLPRNVSTKFQRDNRTYHSQEYQREGGKPAKQMIIITRTFEEMSQPNFDKIINKPLEPVQLLTTYLVTVLLGL